MNHEALTLSDRIRDICREFFSGRRSISALKAVREITGLGLMHSKLIVEHEFSTLEYAEKKAAERAAWEAEGRENGWL